MKVDNRTRILNEGKTAKEKDQDRNTNPYTLDTKLTLAQRLFYTKYAKNTYQEWAIDTWFKGYDDEDNRLITVNTAILAEEEQKAAERLFDLECFKDHQRLNWLMDQYLKRNGGYLDIQAIAILRIQFGDTGNDKERVRAWIDSQMTAENEQKANG